MTSLNLLFFFLRAYHCGLVHDTFFALSPFFFFIHSLLNLLYDTLHPLYLFIFDCIKKVQLGILEGKAIMDGFEFIHLVIIQHIDPAGRGIRFFFHLIHFVLHGSDSCLLVLQRHPQFIYFFLIGLHDLPMFSFGLT